jgi:plasmid stabilization system protein ParE
MERKIVWTERASGEIEAIVRYIRRRDPSSASRIGLGIYDRVQILQQNPEAGSILNELRAGGWRTRLQPLAFSIRPHPRLNSEY